MLFFTVIFAIFSIITAIVSACQWTVKQGVTWLAVSFACQSVSMACGVYFGSLL
jgi:hypothetical protein